MAPPLPLPLLLLLLLLLLGSPGAVEAQQLGSLQPVTGDFLLRANVSECQDADAGSGKNTLEVVFDAVGYGGNFLNYSSYSLEPSTGTIELLRYRHGVKTVLQTIRTSPASWKHGAVSSAPLVIELLRRGTFYLLYLGGSHLTSQPVTYVERPSSDVICTGNLHLVEPEPEPLRSSAGVKDVSGGIFQLNSLRVTEYRWESAPLPAAPLLTHCADCGSGCDPSANRTEGCWAYNQVIPGALLREANGSHRAAGLRNGSVVLYVAGSDFDGTDGGGKQRVGVATGPSLEALSLHPEYLLEGTPNTRDERSLFPNGALLLENGTVALTYMGQAQNDSWGGIFLATSDCAVGCPWRKHGVVLGCGDDATHTSGAAPQVCGGVPGTTPVPKQRPIHEHDLLQLPNGTFALYYAGNTEAGDQGFLATSEDLVTWTNYPANPVLPLPLKECGTYPSSSCWDGEHRRPRSVFQYGEYWYMIYEGTAQHPVSLGSCWGDTIGLSRSKQCEGPFTERHPLQIIIAPQPDPRFDR